MNSYDALAEDQAIATLDHAFDVDSHEMAPGHLWGDLFGDALGEIGRRAEGLFKRSGGQDLYNPSVALDNQPITHEAVWSLRGTNAPGAFDFDRRIEVMNAMGTQRQLIFPTAAVLAVQLVGGAESTYRNALDLGSLSATTVADLGRSGLAEYNDWAARVSQIDPDRLRPVAYLDPSLDVQALETEIRTLIHAGIRAVHFSTGTAPGGVSPAHPDLDPVWHLLATNNVAVTTHVGGEHGFLASHEWVKAPAFAPGRVDSHEIGLEPYSFATLHLSVTNWLSCMILGGVFERHPTLRFGVIESGAAWFGPLVDSLDMWARDVYSVRLRPFMSALPSEYAARNIRVTPFNNFEPVAKYISTYPHLLDCYCYSTDYPHVEGGKDVKRKFYREIAPLGEDAVRRFFVSNGSLLMPD